MTTIKIFLASSNELKAEREAFEQALSRLNKRWKDKNIFFETVIWEDHHDAITQTHTQEQYNQTLVQCHILVVLFWTKMGKYTRQEFEAGYAHFKQHNRPTIYVYEKTAPYLPGNRDAVNSKLDFLDRLNEIGYFQVHYENEAELIHHFTTQLTDGYDNTPPATTQPATGNHSIPHALTTPPFLPDIFLGREAELTDIKAKLFTDNPLLLLVNGEGGMGKTSLAAQYYHRHHPEYRHCAWLTSERNMAETLLLLAPPLGLDFDPQMDTAQRLQGLLRALAQLPAPCLLVLDNANEAEDLAAHYQWLRSCGNFHILLTSRLAAFEQAACYRIEGLPEAEALQLFQQYYPKLQPDEEPLFQQIRLATGGNTLVLEILAKNLARLNKVTTSFALPQLLEDLQQRGVLALSQSAPVSTTYHGPLRRESPEAIIGAMYDMGRLPREEAALLGIFAVLPAENIAYNMLETLLPGRYHLAENLDSLAQNGWLDMRQADSGATFKCSPVVQEIARHKNPELAEDCGLLITTLNHLLLTDGGTAGHFLNTSYTLADTYARYAESLLDKQLAITHNLTILAERLGNYHLSTGNLHKALQWFEKEKTMSESLCQTEPENPDYKNSLAIACQYLGNTQTALGLLPEALEYYENYHRLKKELHEQYPDNLDFKNGLAIACQYLGNTQTALGLLPEALEYYETHHRLKKELHEHYPDNLDFKNGLAIACQNLGNTQAALGRLPKALEYYDTFHRLEKELHEQYPDNLTFKNGLAIACQYLGNTQTDLGLLPKALEYYETYHRLKKELHEQYPDNVNFKNGLAIACQNLGNTQATLGRLPEALEYYETLHRLEKELHEQFPGNVNFKNAWAVACSKLGVFYRDHEPDAALATAYLEQCYRLYEELTRDFPEYAEFRDNFEWAKWALGGGDGADG